jgi:toxin ParE1/3/4
MYTASRTTNADNDLESIADYIAQDNPYRALTFIQEMMNSFERKIALFPKIGI